jgi:hypothetical protein
LHFSLALGYRYDYYIYERVLRSVTGEELAALLPHLNALLPYGLAH